jgi:hypothetical protein
MRKRAAGTKRETRMVTKERMVRLHEEEALPNLSNAVPDCVRFTL